MVSAPVPLDLLLRLLVLDFVAAKAMGCREGIVGHGGILLSVDLARYKLFFVNLWDGRTPFRFVTSDVPPKEEFKSRPWGRVKGQPELWLKIGA